jgi:hypothetical protein
MKKETLEDLLHEAYVEHPEIIETLIISQLNEGGASWHMDIVNERPAVICCQRIGDCDTSVDVVKYLDEIEVFPFDEPQVEEALLMAEALEKVAANLRDHYAYGLPPEVKG